MAEIVNILNNYFYKVLSELICKYIGRRDKYSNEKFYKKIDLVDNITSTKIIGANNDFLYILNKDYQIIKYNMTYKTYEKIIDDTYYDGIYIPIKNHILLLKIDNLVIVHDKKIINCINIPSCLCVCSDDDYIYVLCTDKLYKFTINYAQIQVWSIKSQHIRNKVIQAINEIVYCTSKSTFATQTYDTRNNILVPHLKCNPLNFIERTYSNFYSIYNGISPSYIFINDTYLTNELLVHNNDHNFELIRKIALGKKILILHLYVFESYIIIQSYESLYIYERCL